MHTKNAKSLVFTIGAALAAASCGRTMMTGVDAKDTGKPPGDLLSAGDLLAESSPLPTVRSARSSARVTGLLPQGWATSWGRTPTSAPRGWAT